MAIKFQYDDNRKILIAECEGSIALEDLKNGFATIVHSDKYPPDVPTLWDCRKLDFKNLEKGFEEKLVLLRSLHPERGRAKIALLVTGTLDFGLSRMYEMKSAGLSQHMMVFRDINEAVKWLQKVD